MYIPLARLHAIERALSMTKGRKRKRRLREKRDAIADELLRAEAHALGLPVAGVATATLLEQVADGLQLFQQAGAPDGANRTKEWANPDALAGAVILFGVAILASGGAAAAGAAIVQDVIWKEIVKAVIATAVGTATAYVGQEVLNRIAHPDSAAEKDTASPFRSLAPDNDHHALEADQDIDLPADRTGLRNVTQATGMGPRPPKPGGLEVRLPNQADQASPADGLADQQQPSPPSADDEREWKGY